MLGCRRYTVLSVTVFGFAAAESVSYPVCRLACCRPLVLLPPAQGGFFHIGADGDHLLDGISDRFVRTCAEHSGGGQQRVGLGRRRPFSGTSFLRRVRALLRCVRSVAV